MVSAEPYKGHRRIGWTFEALSLVASAAFFAGIIGLVLKFDGTDVNAWPYAVTLNALVSILSVASKTCLLFAVCESISQWKWTLFAGAPRPLIDFERIDRASRGPLGSARLLFAPSWDRGLIVRLGAIVTLLALAIDPFTQQIIQLRQTIVLDWGSSRPIRQSIGYVSELSGGRLERINSTSLSNGSVVRTFEAVPATYLQAAVLNGLVTSTETLRKAAPYHCPTGDCSWPAFNSLAICNECHDTISQLVRVEGNSIDLLEAYYPRNGDLYPGSSATAFRLPNGQFLANVDGDLSYSSYDLRASGGSETFAMSASGTGDPNKTLSLQHRKTLLWSANVLSIATNFTRGGNWPDEVPLESTECGLYWCVNRYEAELKNNSYSEAVAKLPTEFALDQYQTTDGEQPIGSLEFTEIGTIDWLRLQPLRLCDAQADSQNNDDNNYFDCFLVTGDAALSLNHFFQGLLKADVTPESPSVGLSPSEPGLLHNVAHQIGYQPIPDVFGSIWSIPEPYQSPRNVSDTFDAIALSLTNAIRSKGLSEIVPSRGYGEPESELFQVGTSRPVTFYDMQWQWITLHAVVIFLAVAFFICTVALPGPGRHSNLTSSPSHPPLWKSSALAVMTRGPYASVVLDGAETRGQLARSARGARVALFGNCDEEFASRTVTLNSRSKHEDESEITGGTLRV